MGMEKYIRVKVLGTGSFGSAILVTKVGTREQYVVKEIDVSKMSSPERKAAEQEAKVRRGDVLPTAFVNVLFSTNYLRSQFISD